METPQAAEIPQKESRSKKTFKNIYQFIVYVIAIIVGVIVINVFLFRSFNVSGLSMQQTLQNNDRLIVNRIPVTASEILNKQYIPERGQIIVFKSPLYGTTSPNSTDEFIVKRVIAFGGERVVLKDGTYTVYNSDNPKGFNPDAADKNQPGSPTAGDVDVTVPDGSLFVSGDHRQINPATDEPFSLDSRNGLGYIPLYSVVGPVAIRIFPFTSISTF